MRLNYDYIRDILLFIEKELDYEDSESQTPYKHKELTDGQLVCDNHFNTYNKQELSYALKLLIKEGYVDLACNPNIHNGNIVIARIIGLTWQGHELLDNVRNDTVWNAVKQKSMKFGKFSLTTLAICAKDLTFKLMDNPNAIQDFLQGIDNIAKMF